MNHRLVQMHLALLELPILVRLHVPADNNSDEHQESLQVD